MIDWFSDCLDSWLIDYCRISEKKTNVQAAAGITRRRNTLPEHSDSVPAVKPRVRHLSEADDGRVEAEKEDEEDEDDDDGQRPVGFLEAEAMTDRWVD